MTTPAAIAGCTGKKQYARFTEAAKVASRVRRQDRCGHRLQPYHCRHCNAFHVGIRHDEHGRPAT
jgi:hypothetical protein